MRRMGMVASALALVLTGTLGTPALAQGPIKIGVVTELTGPLAPFGKSNLDGMRVAADEINAAGGVLGRKLELVTVDSGSKSNAGVAAFGRLVSRDQPVVVLGPASSVIASALKPAVRDAKVPLLMPGPFVQKNPLEPPNRYVFYLAPDLAMESVAAATAVARTSWKKIVLMGPDLDTARVQAGSFAGALARLGKEARVVKDLYVPAGSMDFAPALAAARSTGADAVYSIFSGSQAVRFMADARQALGERTGVVQRVDLDLLLAAGLNVKEGLLGLAMAPATGLTSPEAKKFVDQFRRARGTDPGDGVSLGYEALTIAARAVAQARSTEPEKIVEALERGTFEGLRGRIRFAARDHVALAPVYVGTAKRVSESGPYALADIVSFQGETLYAMASAGFAKLNGGGAPGSQKTAAKKNGGGAGGPATPPTLGGAPSPARVYNAYFLDGGVANQTPSQLDPNRDYTFGFYIGAPRAESLLAPQPLDETLRRLAERQGADIDVAVFCRFCRAEQAAQRQSLRVGPSGDTDLLRFPITPVKAGPDKLSIVVEHRRIIVETFTVPVHIGPGAIAAVPRPSARTAANWSDFRGVPEPEVTVMLTRTSPGEFVMDLRVPSRGINVPRARSATEGRVEKLAVDVWLGLRKLVKGLDGVTYTQQEIDTFEFKEPKKKLLLLELARLGREMYRVLFLEDLQYRQLLRHFASIVPSPARVSILTDDLYLPWAILYDGDPDELDRGTAHATGFWGYRYRIQALLYNEPTSTVPGAETGYPLNLLFGHYSPSAASPSKVDQDFRTYREAQETFFRTYAPHLQLALAGSESDFVQALRRVQPPRDVVYVFAHGKGGQRVGEATEVATGRRVPIFIPSPTDAEILFTPAARGISPDDLHRLVSDYDLSLAGSPLVFLNVCEGEAIAAISAESFVKNFMALRARAVITTDAEVWQNFGRDFATSFFERFLDRAYAGDASQILWDLRRQYLDQKGNPFGFLYTIWGYAGMRPKSP